MGFSCLVTGTDTGVGKTMVAAALLHKCRELGFSAIGMKPVAAGCELVGGEACNEDVEALRNASSVPLERGLINPYLFEPAIAPHIAAAEAGIEIDPAHIVKCYRLLANAVECIVVEGAGGFLVPLSAQADTGDLARMLGLPVILVVGMRLGCINHALLTQEAIERRGLVFAGWIANQMDEPMARCEENIASLVERLRAPLMGVIPCLAHADPVAAARYLELPDDA